MAIVAMFAMCAFAVCITADSDAGPYGGISDNLSDNNKDQVYNVDISVGQAFTYSNIKTSLDGLGASDGTLTLTGKITGAAHTGFTFENLTADRTVTGEFTSPGTATLTLTAKWIKHDTDRNVDVTQTATQTFNFTVYQAIDITESTANGYIVGGQTVSDANNVVLNYTGPTTSTSPAMDIQPDISTHKDKFQATLSAGKITISPKSTIAYDEGGNNTYTFTVSMTNTKTTDSDSCTVTYTVYESIAISNDNLTWYTFENDPDAPTEFIVENSYDTDGKNDTKWVSTSFVLDPETGALSKDGTNPNRLTINVDSFDLVADGDISKTYTADITVNGKIEDSNGVAGPTSQATGTFKLVVYQFLEFKDKPTVAGAYASPLTASGSAVTLSSFITAANNVVINWGDGTQTGNMSVTGANVSNTYSAYHNYAKAGLYTITIIASNDMGTTTSQVLYNAGYGDMEIPTDGTDDTDSEKKDFFAEHGWQFLLFAILTIILLIAFFYFGIQNPMVLILAIVFAALAILCYVYNDIGGVIDAVKGFFNKA